ncbi:MAG: DUF655 domain-containing protein [Pelistega sp.]|nr:DUF655 domain-containing protein [Pelistega sp.]
MRIIHFTYFLIACLLIFLSVKVYAVELNSASLTQLMSLKGIGEKTAQRILQERQRAGPYISLEDFSIRVKGIGKKRIESLVNQGLHISPSTVPHALGNSVASESTIRASATDGVSISTSENGLHYIQSNNRQESSRRQDLAPAQASGRGTYSRKKAGSGTSEIAEPKLIKPPNAPKIPHVHKVSKPLN